MFVPTVSGKDSLHTTHLLISVSGIEKMVVDTDHVSDDLPCCAFLKENRMSFISEGHHFGSVVIEKMPLYKAFSNLREILLKPSELTPNNVAVYSLLYNNPGWGKSNSRTHLVKEIVFPSGLSLDFGINPDFSWSGKTKVIFSFIEAGAFSNSSRVLILFLDVLSRISL